MNMDKTINCLLGGALLFGSIGGLKGIKTSNNNKQADSVTKYKCSHTNLRLGLSLSGFAGGLIIIREICLR